LINISFFAFVKKVSDKLKNAHFKGLVFSHIAQYFDAFFTNLQNFIQKPLTYFFFMI